MRDYSKVSPRFWTGDTGRRLRTMGRDFQVIGFYLFTCPSSNMLGLYYLPLPTLSHETGISIEDARKVLRRLSEAPSEPLTSPFEGVFAAYDEASEYVFVTEMAAHQLGERISQKDNRHKAIVKEIEQHRKCPFFNDFVEKYREAFELHGVELNKPLPRAFKAPSEPLRSQEQEQEKEQEQKGDARGKASPPAPRGKSPKSEKAKDFDPAKVPGLDIGAWNAWVIYRAERKPAIKPASMQAAAEELAAFGAQQAAVVRHSKANGYQGLFAPKPNGQGQPAPATVITHDQRERDELQRLMARRAGMGISDFRDPHNGESAQDYRNAQNAEWNKRKERGAQLSTIGSSALKAVSS